MSAERPLCVDVVADGLRVEPTFPTCISVARCKVEGCFWRTWHDIPLTKWAPTDEQLLK